MSLKSAVLVKEYFTMLMKSIYVRYILKIYERVTRFFCF
jgi:hypothetical protein